MVSEFSFNIAVGGSLFIAVWPPWIVSMSRKGKLNSEDQSWSLFVTIELTINTYIYIHTVPSRKRAHYGILAHAPLWAQFTAKILSLFEYAMCSCP